MNHRKFWIILLCGSTLFTLNRAQTAPPQPPKITEIIYPPEASGALGTGAKPGEQITLKGSGLKDASPVNPQPTVVVFPTYDPAHPFKPLPVEITVPTPPTRKSALRFRPMPWRAESWCSSAAAAAQSSRSPSRSTFVSTK